MNVGSQRHGSMVKVGGSGNSQGFTLVVYHKSRETAKIGVAWNTVTLEGSRPVLHTEPRAPASDPLRMVLQGHEHQVHQP